MGTAVQHGLPPSPVADPLIMRRFDYIGGTDASIIMGHQTYDCLFDCWERKVERYDKDLSNEPNILRGQFMEPIILDRITREHDPTIAQPGDGLWRFYHRGPDNDPQIFLIDEAQKYVGGHPDAVGEDTLWEFKASAMRNVEGMYKDGPPNYWKIQVQHYLLITGLPKGRIALWDYDNWTPIIYPNIRAHDGYQDEMRDAYARFWWCVKNEKRPTANEFPEVRHRDQLTEQDDPELGQLVEAYYHATQKRYNGKDEQSKARTLLLSYIDRDHFSGLTPDFVINVSMAKSKNGYPFKKIAVKKRENLKVIA